MIDVSRLFERGTPLCEDDVIDVYTYLAYHRNLSNYNILTLQSLIKGSPLKRAEDIPDYIYDFIAEQGKCLCIANVVGGVAYSIKLKSLKEKKFLTWGTKRSLPYGIGKLSNFSYGDWLVLVEGEKDRDSLEEIYPHVLGVSTAGTSSMMKTILLTLTNRFVLLYDFDESGEQSYRKDKYFFEGKGCQVFRPTGLGNIKDSGTLYDYRFKNDTFNYDFLRAYYQSVLSLL